MISGTVPVRVPVRARVRVGNLSAEVRVKVVSVANRVPALHTVD